MKPLEQVLADWAENAQVLRKTGDERVAAVIEQIVGEMREASEDFIRWLTEEQAMNYAGHSRQWLRKRWTEWDEQGHVKKDGRKRYYRAVIIPRRVNIEAIRAEARKIA